MRWVVFGGCGFLGSALTRALVANGAEVSIYDSLIGPGSARRSEELSGLPGVSVAESSTSDAGAVLRFMEAHRDATALACVSGQVSMLTSLDDPRADMEANFLGPFNILEAMRAVEFQGAAILASTNKVYGPRTCTTRELEFRHSAPEVDESARLDFKTPYGCSKGAADQYWLDYASTYGLRTVVLRHSSMYGQGQIGEVGHGWVAWFVAQARADATSIRISGDGKQVRDLLHVEDAARAYLAVADNIDRCAGRAYNVGGGAQNSLSILELVGWLGERLTWDPAVVMGPPRLADQLSFIADNGAFRASTGWEPRVSYSEGLSWLL